MTEEQRAKLLAALENPEHDRFPARTARDAAKEIERLVAHNEKLAREVRFLIEQQQKADPRDMGVAE